MRSDNFLDSDEIDFNNNYNVKTNHLPMLFEATTTATAVDGESYKKITIKRVDLDGDVQFAESIVYVIVD